MVVGPVKIDEIGDGALPPAIHSVAQCSTRDQGQPDLLQVCLTARGPDQQAYGDNKLEEAKHAGPGIEPFTPQPEADAIIEAEPHIEKRCQFDDARRHHDLGEDQPLGDLVGR